jgi:hypothetical protein
LELNRLFVGRVETECHHRTYTETGQFPLDRSEARWDRLGRTPALPTADDLAEAFLWSECRVTAKTATVSLQHLAGRPGPGRPEGRAGVLFCHLDLETVHVGYHNKGFGTAVPHASSATDIPRPGCRPRHHADAAACLLPGDGVYQSGTVGARHDALYLISLPRHPAKSGVRQRTTAGHEQDGR